MVQPEEFSVRSFSYRTLIGEGARFGERCGAAVALDYGEDTDVEKVSAGELGIADLSPLPRTGFKGRRALEWLCTQDLEIGDDNNHAYAQTAGSLIARLADTEAIVLGPLSGDGGCCKTLDAACEAEHPERCFHVPRMDASAWYVITGVHASAMFAKICGVDLRLDKFRNGSIAQTSMARMNVIAIRHDLGETPAFHLLFDSASSAYLWDSLRDAMAEFHGVPVGHNAIRALGNL